MVLTGLGSFLGVLAAHYRQTKQFLKLRDMVIGVLGAIVGSVIAEVVVTHSAEILRTLTRLLGLYGMRAFIAILVIGFGVAAYWWKRKSQRSYGIGEVIFGSIAAVFITFGISPERSLFSQWVGLGGAAYIIARGLNNVSEATEKTVYANSV
jgi:hypothetical protein